MAELFLESLSYALGRDRVEVAGGEDVVNDEGVGRLNIRRERCCNRGSELRVYLSLLKQ